MRYRNTIVSYKCKKQTIVALSSFEAGLIALVNSVQIGLHIRNLLKFMGEPVANEVYDSGF